MNLAIAAAVFPVIFIGELPDKTMIASLVMASRGRPRAVWLGAAAAFLVHVVIATTIGVGLFALLPHRAVDGLVAVLFIAGAVYAFVEGQKDQSRLVEKEAASHRRVVTTAFVVIFIAEWGDLTQILTANLAAHYHSPLSVGVGAVVALWAVAALAVTSGQTLLRFFPMATVRRATAVVLLILGCVAAWSALR
ncbi:MAG TPA: TMEM165/GDT1 family protein [Acidimicrobiales bacterium]|nr:TMEM165/GDT1 family protein [Acidimicrobiales bacterium]